MWCFIYSLAIWYKWAWYFDQCYQVKTVQKVSSHSHLWKGSHQWDALVPETKTEEGEHVFYWQQVITHVLLMEGSGKVWTLSLDYKSSFSTVLLNKQAWNETVVNKCCVGKTTSRTVYFTLLSFVAPFLLLLLSPFFLNKASLTINPPQICQCWF